MSGVEDGEVHKLPVQIRDKVIKTEVSKAFSWGFLLREAELRRILRACFDHAGKVPFVAFTTSMDVTLRDGSHLSCSTPEDILSIENHGRRSVRELRIRLADRLENADWLMEISFQDGVTNPRSWTSVDFTVVGQDRDWTFLAATEIEEQLLRTRKFSLAPLIANRMFPMFLFMSFFLVMMVMMFTLNTGNNVADGLEKMHKTGVITDPIDALIFVEREKASAMTSSTFLIRFIGPALGIGITATAVLYFLPKIVPAYVFYWGDAVADYDRRASILKTIWYTIVLGALAAIIGGIVLSYFQK